MHRFMAGNIPAGRGVQLKTSDFDYHLPEDLIAQIPKEPRDHSRLMVVDRGSDVTEHRMFYELPELLNEGDVLVFNDTRVLPARLLANRLHTGGNVELLLLQRISKGLWRALVRPGRRMRRGAAFEVDGGITGEVVEVEEDGTRRVRLWGEELLNELGLLPLPPYIRQELQDPSRYQTLYGRIDGSVAAPTAGLHFTPNLMRRAQDAGAELVFATLHVGWDSFRPVKSDAITGHKMHSEYWELGTAAAAAVNSAHREGRRVVSVGTTAVRLLEHAALLASSGPSLCTGDTVAAGSGWADLFIYPGFNFKVVDALITNFHLPMSTLLMLTSAFAGRERVLNAYREAAEMRYRFYSFGDAMFIR